MEICGHSHSFTRWWEQGQVEISAIIRFFRELDLRAVELTDAFISAEKVASVRALLDELGMFVVCSDVACDFATADPLARQAETARLRAGIERAAALGSRYVLTYPGQYKEGLSPDAIRQWFAAALRECLPVARQHGITLTIPDVGIQPLLSGTSAHLNQICDAAGPEVRVTYDVGNFVMAGEDPIAALDRVAPRIAHVHVKDWQILPASAAPPEGAFVGLDGRYFCGTALGEGELDLPAMLRGLTRIGYQGFLSIEYEGTGDPREAVRTGVDYLRDRL